MMRMQSRQNQRGYSLIEVIVAMGVLSSVLLTVITLFYLARRNVYGGKKMTSAIAVGTRVMEDLSTLSAASVLTAFSVDASTTLAAVSVQPTTLPDSTYDGSIVRTTRNVATAGVCGTTPTITFANDPQQFMQRWYCQMNTLNNELPSGSVTLVLTPRRPHPTTAALTPVNASTLRIRALIRWREGARWRQVIVDQAKTRRF